MRPIWILALCLVSVAASGCFGDDEAGTQDTGTTGTSGPTRTPTSSPNSTSPSSPSPSGTGSPPYGTTQSPNGTANATSEWTYDNRTGSVSGANLLVSGPSAEEALSVASGVLQMFLNVTASGDELTVVVTPPGCESADCEKEQTTQDGNASLSFSAPPEGSWSVRLAAEGLGPVSSEYALEAAQLVPSA